MHTGTTDCPASPDPFDYRPQTRVIFGLNSIERVGGLAVELGARNVLLVTDRGIVSAGHAGRVSGLLEGVEAENDAGPRVVVKLHGGRRPGECLEVHGAALCR